MGTLIIDVEKVDEEMIKRELNEGYQKKKLGILSILKKCGKLRGEPDALYFSDRQCVEAIIGFMDWVDEECPYCKADVIEDPRHPDEGICSNTECPAKIENRKDLSNVCIMDAGLPIKPTISEPNININKNINPNKIDNPNKIVKKGDLQEFRDTHIGLWATDRPDKIPKKLKEEYFFEIKP